jgi:3D-(3,5/4)-trihydroxycyclohexane-1,2-dione acylhydrolase (decyclizing)
MGYEIVAGLGVAAGRSRSRVVVMVGDGSYLMMNSEIVTAVAEGLKLTIVVLDNHGFQCILALQRLVGRTGLRQRAALPRRRQQPADGPNVPIDFRGNAESMGALALTPARRTSCAMRSRRRRARTGSP